jgi:hypothetical protein
MFDKLLHHKLLTEGLAGQGVITRQKVEAAKGEMGIMGFYIGVEGHIKFTDGTVGQFESKGLDTSKVGDLDAGTIVPVRYNDEHTHVVLDIPKLEAERKATKKAAAERLERHKAEQIDAADAALAQGHNNAHHDRGSGAK